MNAIAALTRRPTFVSKGQALHMKKVLCSSGSSGSSEEAAPMHARKRAAMRIRNSRSMTVTQKCYGHTEGSARSV